MVFLIVAAALFLVALILSVRIARRVKDWRVWTLPFALSIITAIVAIRMINELPSGPFISIVGYWSLATLAISLAFVVAMYFLDRSTKSAQQAESSLMELNKELDLRVRERTSELERANQALEDELGKRKKAEGRKRGQIIWGSLTACVVREGDGRPLYGVGLVENITERKQARDALQRSEALNRGIVEAVPAGIIHVDIGGKIVQANNQAPRGLPRICKSDEVSSSVATTAAP